MVNEKRLYSLDLLKFILSIVIVFHHFQQATGLSLGIYNFYGGSINFALAVEFFFIISGFLCAMSFSKKKDLSLHRYVIGTIKKIYPTIVLSTIVCWIAVLIFYFIRGEFYSANRADVFQVFTSFLMIFSGGAVDAGLGLNNPLWYICVLLVCHVIYYISRKLANKWTTHDIYFDACICLMGVGIITYKINLPFFNETIARGYSTFFYGSILYGLYKNVNKKKLSALAFVVTLVCAGFVVIDYASFFKNEWGGLTFVLFPSIMFTMLGLNSYLSNSFVRKLGDLSTQAYIWHSPMLLILNETNEIMGGSVLNNNSLFQLGFALFVMLFSLAYESYVKEKADKCFFLFISWIRN